MSPVARVVLVLSLGVFSPTQAADQFITVASTTSTEQSGLFAHLLPEFTKSTGIEVRVVALGTGQALDMGRRGDADVVFVHDREAEKKFVADGYGVRRFDVMYNDFVLAGPRSDPAKVKGKQDIAAAFRDIARKKATFVSRADRSGTHAAELRLWKAADIDIANPPQEVPNAFLIARQAAKTPTGTVSNAVDFDKGTLLIYVAAKELRKRPDSADLRKNQVDTVSRQERMSLFHLWFKKKHDEAKVQTKLGVS